MKEMSKEGTETAHACDYAGIPRSTYYYRARPRPQKSLDPVVSSLARVAAERYPTYGYRRLAAVVSKGAEKPVNRKKMRRIMAELNLLQEPPKRRSYLTRSREPQTATVPNRFWQGDMTKVWCGADGWGYLFTVVETCTREWVGYAFSPFCRAKEALCSVEMAVQRKFPASWKAEGVTLRTDNGSQYTARYFVANLKALGIDHERARYRTPEDIGIVESLHKNVKRDYLWLYDFGNFQEAAHVILNAFDHYNRLRPHSSLGYRSPLEYLTEVEQRAS